MKIKKFLLFSLLCLLAITLFGCQSSGANGKDGKDGINGITPQLRINSENNNWEVSYNNGTTWTSLGVKATGDKGSKGESGEDGENGENGTNGITPQLSINEETNMWQVSYDNGTTWASLGVKATGDKGSKGSNGTDGITPQLRVDSETNMWEVSYDGKTWLSLGVSSNGPKGDNGVTPQIRIEDNEWQVSYDNGTTWASVGANAKNVYGITPQLRINASYWEVSYDNGTTWNSLGVKATCGNGTDTDMFVPITYKNYDGSILSIQYVINGTTAVYTGEIPEKPQEINGTTVTDYTFNGWGLLLDSVTTPTIVTAQFTATTFKGTKVIFTDVNDNVLCTKYYANAANASYPYEFPYRYDATNVYMFAGWEKNQDTETGVYTYKATELVISREKNGEYPQSLVTTNSLINALNKITTVDEKGYITYKNEKYFKYTNTEAYTANDGSIIPAGTNYYKVEPIKWRIVSTDETNNRMCLISEYVIDNQIINELYSGNVLKTDYKGAAAEVPYSNYKYSYIRNWLNTTFLTKAFTDNSLLLEVEVNNGISSIKDRENPYVCENTYDKVVLPSIKEAYTLNSYNKLNAKITDYARAQGFDALYNNYTTRSPYEYTDGYYVIGIHGNEIVWFTPENKFGIRPAIYISTESAD